MPTTANWWHRSEWGRNIICNVTIWSCQTCVSVEKQHPCLLHMKFVSMAKFICIFLNSYTGHTALFMAMRIAYGLLNLSSFWDQHEKGYDFPIVGQYIPCNCVIDCKVVGYPHRSGSYNGQSTPCPHSREVKMEYSFLWEIRGRYSWHCLLVRTLLNLCFYMLLSESLPPPPCPVCGGSFLFLLLFLNTFFLFSPSSLICSSYIILLYPLFRNYP